MKKLKLSIEQLEQAEVLTRSQLKNVLGGITASLSCSGWLCTYHTVSNPTSYCQQSPYSDCGCYVDGSWHPCIYP